MFDLEYWFNKIQFDDLLSMICVALGIKLVALKVLVLGALTKTAICACLCQSQVTLL